MRRAIFLFRWQSILFLVLLYRASFPGVLLSPVMYLLQQEQLPACTKQTCLHDIVLLLLSPGIDIRKIIPGLIL